MEITECENVVMKPDFRPAVTSSYRYPSMLFSWVGWPEPKLGMKQPRSGEKGMMHVQTTLKMEKRQSFGWKEESAQLSLTKMKISRTRVSPLHPRLRSKKKRQQ